MHTLHPIANLILTAVRLLEAETRYEEDPWPSPSGRVAGSNEVLRHALGAPPGECRYPQSVDRCDVVFVGGGMRIWLEVKHSWTWATYTKPFGRNGRLKKHLYGAGCGSALDDAQVKLPSLLGRPDADVIGLLVIALDSQALPYPVGEIHTLEELASLCVAPWQQFTQERWMSSVPGFETIGVRPFLWLRPATALYVPALA